MTNAVNRTLVPVLAVCIMIWFVLLLIMPPIIAETQDKLPMRSLPIECLSEPDCPVAIISARTELELDTFGMPLAFRLYTDYKNVSDKAINAVKFRVRFVDSIGKERGTFQAPHVVVVSPGATASEKWRHERVDPRSNNSKMRVLFVKFVDGTTWQSAKTGAASLSMPQESSPNLGQE